MSGSRDRIILGVGVVGLALVVSLAPWPGGAAEPEWLTRFALMAATLLLLFATSPTAGATLPTRHRRWLVCAVVSLVGLGFLQIVPLGAAVRWVSPASATLRDAYIPAEAEEWLSTISLYPYRTRLATLGLAVALALGTLAARCGGRRSYVHLILGALVLSAAANACWGVALRLGEGVGRAHGSYPSPNHFAGMLALCLPLSLALAGVGIRQERHGHTSRRTLWLFTSAVLACGCLLSVSRSGIMAAVAGVCVYAYLVSPRSDKGSERIYTFAVGFGLVALAALVGIEAVALRFERLVHEPELERIAFWGIALRIFLAFPILGAGLRSHEQLSPAWLESPRLLSVTHNDYLNLLADMGLVGGALIAVVVVVATAVLRDALRRAAAGPQRSLLAGTIAGLAPLLVAGLVEFNLQVHANLWAFATLFGLALGQASRLIRGSQGARPARVAERWALVLGALCLVANAGPLAISRWFQAQGLEPDLPVEARIAHLSRAQAWAPEFARLSTFASSALLEAGRVEEAVAAGRRACAKEPRNAVHHNHLARALLARDEVEEARKELKRAARLAPHFPLTRLHEGELRLWLHRRTAGDDPTDRLNALVAFRAVLQGDSDRVNRVFEALEGEVLSPADIRHLLSEDAGPRLRRRVVARLRAVGARAAAAEALAPLVQAGRLVDLRLRAQLYLDQGEGVKAALALRDCLHAVGEGSLGAELRWGSKLLLRANLTELAERLCYEADGLYPGKATVKLELGRVLLIRRKPQEASHVLERAWALGLSKCCPLLGQSYWNAGKPKLAIATWREGLGAPLDRDSSLDLRLRLAQALHAQGQTREAAQLAREVLRLEPEHPLGRRLAAEDQ